MTKPDKVLFTAKVHTTGGREGVSRSSDDRLALCLADGAYFLQTRLNVRVRGVERDVAQGLVDVAHQTCPYSKATRGNIDVVIDLV